MYKLSNLDFENNFEAKLLLELSPELSNFRSGFKGRTKYTYVLTPYGSTMFDVDIIDDLAVVAVPESIFKILYQVSIDKIAIIYDRPGMFVLFNLGKGEDAHQVALRIHLRRRRVNVLSAFTKVLMVPIDPQGSVIPFDGAELSVDLEVIEGLTWERK